MKGISNGRWSFSQLDSVRMRRVILLMSVAVLLAGCTTQNSAPDTSAITTAEDAAVGSADEPIGKSLESVTGSLQGSETRRYGFDVAAGDHVYIQMVTDNSSNYFNVTPASNPSAIFIGSIAGQQFRQQFDQPGTYELLVYLMRSAARRNEAANFQLIVRGARAVVDLNREPKAAAGMHPSWDRDGDGINDCENDGSCDHTVDYSKPRP